MYVFIEELAVARMAELQREMERSYQTSAWLSEGVAILAVWLRRVTGLPFARPVRRGFTRMVEVDGERG